MLSPKLGDPRPLLTGLQVGLHVGGMGWHPPHLWAVGGDSASLNLLYIILDFVVLKPLPPGIPCQRG